MERTGEGLQGRQDASRAYRVGIGPDRYGLEFGWKTLDSINDLESDFAYDYQVFDRFQLANRVAQRQGFQVTIGQNASVVDDQGLQDKGRMCEEVHQTRRGQWA